jgi:signal transduction histidine kinase
MDPLHPDRRSLGWKLPWQFALTAALTVAAFGLFAYGAVRRMALETTATRLESVLSQVKTIVELGVVTQLNDLRTAARNPAVAAALTNGDRPISDSALATLRRLKGVSDSTVVVQLVDRQGNVRHVLPLGNTTQPDTVTPPPYAVIGRMYERAGAVFFESSVSVPVGRDTVGQIRVIRQLRNGVNRRIVANMLDRAVLLTGNASGTLWGDTGQIDYPATSHAATNRYLRNGERWVSVSAPIRDTPWMYAVELPERIALAPAHAIVLPFVVSGLLIAFLGAFIGHRVGRRITTPLADLTTATEAIARGERNVSLVAVDRLDEIGRLARAFRSMAESVAGARDRLEAEVDARTGELSTVSGQLRVLHEELRESERFATLGRLSGSVGHELRNPLGVMSNVVFLLDTLPEASDKLRDYARLLREQIRVSDRIISDLLDRARFGAPVRSAVDVARLLDDTLMRADIPDSIRVDRRIAAMPKLVLDRDHVTQILWNLVRNAVQAMDGDPGVLTVTTTWSDKRLRVEVRDSGDGIAAADNERIFEPMYTTKAQGIGLGLSVSRAFARANGGDLSLVPGDGGACFVLDLPAEPAPDESDATRDPAAGLQPTMKNPATSRVRRDSPPPRLESV